ncbi:fucose-binding protein [Rhizobiales bacterium TNE-4]|nr:fucose-binding protein [Rhizobiales bacterium TNE-4]MBV1827707.1 fucose-binding protein [Rhizobiales bacterium TNE-4]
MLKNIDPLLNADLLWVLAAMGHGDDLALVDANHPADTVASHCIVKKPLRVSAATMANVARAILTVFPLDDFTVDPVRRMEVVGAPAEVPPIQREVQSVVDAVHGRALPMMGIERYAFYEAAKQAFAVVQVSDARPYGCFLFRKGVIAA